MCRSEWYSMSLSTAKMITNRWMSSSWMSSSVNKPTCLFNEIIELEQFSFYSFKSFLNEMNWQTEEERKMCLLSFLCIWEFINKCCIIFESDKPKSGYKLFQIREQRKKREYVLIVLKEFDISKSNHWSILYNRLLLK